MNPLLNFTGLPRFAEIKPEHVGPAVNQLLAEGRALVERLVAIDAAPDWDGFVAPLENGHERLARALEGKFSFDEQQTLAAFFRSGFGQRMTGLERDAALLGPAAQTQAISRGEAILAAAPVIRSTQIDQLMELVSAEISAAMVGQSLRALLLGLSVSHQHGQIAVPWEEIDTQVKAMMPDLLTNIGKTQRAMMAYAYRDLSDDELDRYIGFLRTAAAQKFYAIAAYAVGRIVADGMADFGEAFAARMQSVNV